MKSLLDREDSVFNPPRSGCVLSLTGLPGGDGKIYDRSPYGNIGTITGATWRPLPSGLWCLSFDGTDDYVDLGADPLSDNDFSITLWFKGGENASKAILSSYDAATPYFYLRVEAGKFEFTGQDSDAGGEVTRRSTASIDDDVWHHLGVVIDIDTEIYTHVDGVEGTTNVRGTVAKIDATLHGKTLRLAEHPIGSGELTGNIALVRLYQRALSGLEIQNHFSQEKHLFGVW